MKLAKIYIVLLISILSVFAAFDYDVLSARTASLAGITTANPHSDSAASGNPAQLGFQEDMAASVSFAPSFPAGDETAYLMDFGASFVLPIPKGAAGASFDMMLAGVSDDLYSGSLYNELNATLAYALPLFDRLSLGLAVSLEHWGINKNIDTSTDNAPPWLVDVKLGTVFKVNDEISLGLSAENLLRMEQSAMDGTKVRAPLDFRFGGGYKGERFMVLLETGHNFDKWYDYFAYRLDIRAAGELYFLEGRLRTAAGFEARGRSAFAPSIGIGLNMERYFLDYGMVYPINLGGSGRHLLSFSFIF